MDSVQVKFGAVRVSRTVCKPLVLLQTEDYDGAARVTMTIEEAEAFIERFQEVVAKVKKYPNGLKDCQDLNEIY
jgi:lipid II:glycine glycyltransferase (peptidoglycan interpeptide bridge formation enzyme)